MKKLDPEIRDWVQVIGTILALAAIAYYAGQISRDLELLRSDYMSHEQQWLSWLMQHLDQ